MSAIEMPYRTTFSCAQAACGTTSAVVVAAKSERRESFMMSPDGGKSAACVCDSRARLSTVGTPSRLCGHGDLPQQSSLDDLSCRPERSEGPHAIGKRR